VGRAFLLVLLAALSACGDDPDNWEAGRPLIRKLTYLQQKPSAPYMLTFAIEFEDSDGDLSQGKIHLYANDQERAVVELREIFERRGIELDAVLGELEIDVSIADDIQAGEKVKLGFMLEDGAGKTSNDPSVVLKAFMPGG
jgi:hypothetical protein